MKYSEWKDRTRSLAKTKLFDRVSAEAQSFLKEPSIHHAQQLERTLTSWINIYWNLWEGAEAGIREIKWLYSEVVAQLYQRAIVMLGHQAIEMEVRFGAFLPETYVTTLRRVFIAPQGCAVKNFKWYQTDDVFESRFRKLLPEKSGWSSFVNGFTYPAECRRNLQFPEILGGPPPGDRVIELKPNFDNGTAFHELLHWMTHKEFEDQVAKIPEKQFDIIEGVTEYLTRQVRSEHTSYQDQLRTVAGAVTAGTIKDAMLKKAYFCGENAEAVAYALATLTDIADDERRIAERAEADRFKISEGKRKADLLQTNKMWGRRAGQTRGFWDDDVIAYLQRTPIDQLQRDYLWDAGLTRRIQDRLREFKTTA
ncbi:MAG: hypothetical protein ACREMQ_11975 [Longimicrobiales bacterium]